MIDEVRKELADKHGIYVDEFLGQGGFGQVYRAHKEAAGLRLWFALKISLERIDLGSEAIQKELRGLEQIKECTTHPHIVGLLDVLIVGGFLVTLWQLADECLAKRLKWWQQQGRPGIPRDELCKYMREAAVGIDFLNGKGLYHRDIKPGNLLLFHGLVKLGDLGWAKFIGDSEISQTGVVTLGYAPPEAYNHVPATTRDLYGLIATYIRLCTGHEPFGNDVINILPRQSQGQPDVSGLDAHDAELVRQGLAARHEHRPQDGAVAWVSRLVGDSPGHVPVAWPAATPIIPVPVKPASQEVQEFRLDEFDVSIQATPLPQVVQAGLPPIPDDVRELEGKVAALQDAISRLKDGSHPSLSQAKGVVQQAEAQWFRLQTDLEARMAPIPQDVRERLTRELTQDPDLKPYRLCDLAPSVPASVLVAFADRWRDVQFARRVLDAVSQKHRELPRTALADLERKLREAQQQLTARKEQDLTQVVEAIFARCGATWPFPSHLWQQFAPVLAQRRYPWDAAAVQSKAEERYKDWFFARWGELRVLEGHDGPLTHAAFSHDGRRVVTASTDKTARIWDAQSGEVLVTLAGHSDGLCWAEFSPDGKTVATASADETARLWDAGTGKLLQTLAGHRGLVRSASFSADGREVLTASGDGTVRTWDVQTGKQQKKWKLSAFTNPKKTKPGSQTRLVIPLGAQPHPQGQGFVTGCGDKVARTWNGEKTTPALELAGHDEAVLTAQYDRDGKRILTASRDGTARVFDAETGSCMQTLKSSDGPLRCGAFSRDGKVIATASRNGKLRVWDSASGQVIKTLAGHNSPVWSVGFSPDGKLLSASLDGTTRLWGFGDHSPAARNASAPAAHRYPQGAQGQFDESAIEKTASKRFASAQGTWGCCLGLAVVVGLFAGIVFSGSHQYWWSDAGGDPGAGTTFTYLVELMAAVGIALFAAAAVAPTVYVAAFSLAVPLATRLLPRRFRQDPTGRTIAACILSELPTDAVDVWLARCLLAKSLPRNLARVFVSCPFGIGLGAAAVYGGLGVFLLLNSYPFTPEPLNNLPLTLAEFSSDGQFLAGTRFEAPFLPWREAAEDHLGLALRGVESGGDEQAAIVWSATRGARVRSLEGHRRLIYAAIWSADGKKIATASWDKTARIWDAATGKCLQILAGHTAAVFRVAFSPNGKSLATASYDGDVRLWNVDTGAELFVLKGHIQPVYSVQFSAGGDRLVTTSFDGTVRIWDARSGQQVHMFSKTGKPFTSHQPQRNAASHGVFSPDGTQVLVTWCNGSMELRDTSSGRVLLEMPAPEDKERRILRTVPAFSPDGTLVATGIDHAVHVWNIRERKLRYALSGHEDDLFLVAFSPDGKRLVSASKDDTARLWDVSSGKSLHVLQGHTDDVWCAAFSPDGKLVATASKDNTPRVWRVESGDLVHVLAD